MAERGDGEMAERRSDARMGTNQAQQQGHSSGHGHSAAAWAAVSVTMVGSLVLAIGVILASWWVGIIGAVIAVLGAVVGKVMSMMGFGPHLTLDSAIEDEGPGRDVRDGGVR